jgi:hypothetical protein
MNYFERLIRRALLEAPAQPGEVLRDPFENEAPLALDAPAAAPARSRAVPAPVAAPPPPGMSVERSPQTVIRTEPGLVETRELTVPSEAPTLDPLPRAAPERPALPAAPLAQADAFMRALGVEVAMPAPVATPIPRQDIAPLSESARRAAEPAAAESPQTDAVARGERPVPRVRPAEVEPPPVPRREPAAAPATTPPPHEARPRPTSPSRAAPDRPAPARPVREVVRERIHVVNIVRDGAAQSSANAGAAPPTFGAAQL